jgi:alkaline phosphatase
MPAKLARAALLLISVLFLSSCDSRSATAVASQPARNVILFIGDGMGVSTVTAARIFDGQSKGLSGEEHVLSFERFPHIALVKTYNTNQQVPDSAGTVTAMLTGEKTRAGVINVGPDALRQSCDGALENRLEPITQRARREGKAIGVVTTTRLTHATPAGMYAWTPERDWEDNRYIDPADQRKGCRDIAWQLLNHPDGGLDIAMGGGSRHFFGVDRLGERPGATDDLVRDWLAKDRGRTYISSAGQLDGLTADQQVLGLFTSSHMTYKAQKTEDSMEPSLTEMATTAVRLLNERDRGFFLMVEGGRIDHAHHDSKPGYALVETQELANAVAAVLDMVDTRETLVMVTADHSHVFALGGYPTRGNPILGHVIKNDSFGEPTGEADLAADGQPYTTLSYANGPGAVRDLPRPTPETGIEMMAQSLVPVVSLERDGSLDYDETHAGEDVVLYAIGPGAESVKGVIEQNLIYDIMIDAFGWVVPDM